MKTKFLYIAALALLVSFTACEKETPFDSQKEDDAPIILRPYDESGSGSYNPTRPSNEAYVDSVVVIPSAYTTVYWYVDGELVHTGNKIDMYFPVGKYTLRIEAVTKSGKMTYRTGSLTITPIDTDPSSDTPAGGRYAVPSQPLTFNGKNLSQVQEVILSKGVTYEAPALHTLTPTAQADDQLTITMPEMENGKYYVRFKDAAGKLYGCDNVMVTRQAMVISGYNQFIPSQEWTITGINLENVASVKVGETVITELTASANAVTLTAPAVEIGEYTLSMANKDGSAVLFQTADGLVEQVTTKAQEKIITEVTIWEGSCVINWGDANVHIAKSIMAGVPAGSQVFVYYNVPDAEYHALRVVVAPDWSADILPQVDGMENQPNPYSFIYDEVSKAKAESDEKDGILVTGFGLEIIQITYK